MRKLLTTLTLTSCAIASAHISIVAHAGQFDHFSFTPSSYEEPIAFEDPYKEEINKIEEKVAIELEEINQPRYTAVEVSYSMNGEPLIYQGYSYVDSNGEPVAFQVDNPTIDVSIQTLENINTYYFALRANNENLFMQQNMPQANGRSNHRITIDAPFGGKLLVPYYALPSKDGSFVKSEWKEANSPLRASIDPRLNVYGVKFFNVVSEEDPEHRASVPADFAKSLVDGGTLGSSVDSIYNGCEVEDGERVNFRFVGLEDHPMAHTCVLMHISGNRDDMTPEEDCYSPLIGMVRDEFNGGAWIANNLDGAFPVDDVTVDFGEQQALEEGREYINVLFVKNTSSDGNGTVEGIVPHNMKHVVILRAYDNQGELLPQEHLSRILAHEILHSLGINRHEEFDACEGGPNDPLPLMCSVGGDYVTEDNCEFLGRRASSIDLTNLVGQ